MSGMIQKVETNKPGNASKTSFGKQCRQMGEQGAGVIDTASETIRRLTGDIRPEIHPTPCRNILNEIKSGRSEMNKAEMSCDPATCRGC
jgi:hypothetical protein